MKPLNKYIDHTALKAVTTKQEIIKLCKEAKTYNFFSVCVNSVFVPLAYELLKDCDINICSVVGFPLGAMDTESKAFEALQAIKNGADEIDMVINVGLLKSKAYDAIVKDISKVKQAIGDKILKVILETCYLTEDEIIKACELCIEAKADFVKTSTGFGTGGATIAAVKTIKKTIKHHAKVKASGGIRDYETAIQFINLGVERLGVSAGIAIINGEQSDTDY
ncbi:MAG: deoxyribose-phosphate aldolase [Flavobacteriaceae bacterium]|nr:deoxyribose-phosphate aldolase [Flavobacteriaceae bacterium]